MRFLMGLSYFKKELENVGNGRDRPLLKILAGILGR